MRHETYIDVLKSVFLTGACLIFFPLLLPAISPSQDPIGEEEEEQSASIHNVDSLSDASAGANGAPENLLIFGEEEEEQSASIHNVDSLSDASSDDWYIPAVIPYELRAPMRASAAGCLTDSILTFNQDSVLTEATTYDYDDAGRTIRTTVWQYNADGSRTGKSKQEYAFDASGTQIYTGTFAWDAATNDWKGTSKSEYVYNEAHKMESNITYTWVNNTWLPSQALTYAYDAAGRETEFTTYARNASLNRLVPSKQRLQTWYNASKKTLEINYTAYANGAWSAGTRKDYDYDANGNQIEYTYYSSYAGGKWVGSYREIYRYISKNVRTLYEYYTWKNNDWTISSREISGYDAAGNNTLVENYSFTNGVKKGTKKEEYSYNAKKKKINTYKYKWIAADTTWVYNTWAVTDFDAAGNATETANYIRGGDSWVGSGTRTLKTYNSSKNVILQITQTWPSGATDWVNATRDTTTYQGSLTLQTMSFIWQNGVWVGESRSDWNYNAAGQNDTIKTYTNNGTDWTNYSRIVYSFDSHGNNYLVHNSVWNGARWVMTSMSRADVDYDAAGNMTLSAAYNCGGDSIWVGNYKSEYEYDELNRLTISNQFSWSNGDWQCVVRAISNYDASNHKILEERTLLSDGVWIGDYRSVSAYNQQGRQILSERYTWKNGNWYGMYKYVYAYDTKGNQLESWTYNWQDTVWQPSISHIYKYDSQNRQVEEIVSRRTSTSSFAPDIKYEYIYGGNNMIVVSNQYGWDGSLWILRSQNKKEYDLNDSKLRREIVGSWTLIGTLSSYTDKHYFYSCDAPTVNNGSQPRTPTELEEIDENNVQPFDPTQPAYNLQGQSIDPATYHGIVIQNGKKYILR